MAVHIVKKLDRAPEDNGLPVVSNIPLPPPCKRDAKIMNQIRKTFAKMKTGDSFVWHEARHIYLYARKFGVRITVRKMGGAYRVWML